VKVFPVEEFTDAKGNVWGVECFGVNSGGFINPKGFFVSMALTGQSQRNTILLRPLSFAFS
jgi:hypothetical protein